VCLQIHQRLSSWRNNMGSAALAALVHFMMSQKDVKTDQGRKALATELRKDYAFLYETIGVD
ncbi:hypothetical protein HYDPIDRAFT_68322, partial [Hydnomerulius pinastri MD-312]